GVCREAAGAPRRGHQGCRGLPRAGPAPPGRDGGGDGLGHPRVGRPRGRPGMAATVELSGQGPPQSPEAGGAGGGGRLPEPPPPPRAIELLTPEEFYKEAHRKIFGAMIRLFERGESPDVILVAETLRRDGMFEESGGHTLLATLQEEGTVATQFQAYAAVV